MSDSPIPDGALRIIKKTFLCTADENYITARWSYFNSQAHDFMWCSLHCIEKYSKYVLLLNGGCAKPYKHNIVDIIKEIERLRGTLPIKFDNPFPTEKYIWISQTFYEFLEYLEKFGNSHNRYAESGIVFRWDDILKLDQAVFGLRRLSVDLSEVTDWIDGKSEHWIEKLSKYPDHVHSMNAPLEKVIRNKNDSRHHWLLNQNSVFGKNYGHNGQLRAIADNSIYNEEIVDLLHQGDEESAKAAMEAANWIRKNLKISDELKADFVEAEQAFKNRRNT